MGKVYSLDLRKKVIYFISQGGQKRKAARLFNVGTNTRPLSKLIIKLIF